MICENCGEKISFREYHWRQDPVSLSYTFSCSPKAERSGVLQGCPPSATGSAAVEAAKLKLIGKACVYGAAIVLLDKCPQLGDSECFRMCLGETSQDLARAAREYFAAVCAYEPPNGDLRQDADSAAPNVK